jgi:S-adenosylmethionine hydrolase
MAVPDEMILTFTDFGTRGPYLGQMEMTLRLAAPGVAVIHLLADAPTFDPRASAYLLAAVTDRVPAGSVVLGVVDPGVGGRRAPLVVLADGRWFVGPDNGLFELVTRRAAHARAWEIVWRPDRLSATFHGRDLFAPVAARLALGEAPEAIGCVEVSPPRRPDWPDDLAAVIYLDHYGNAWSGLRETAVATAAVIGVGGLRLSRARTFEDAGAGKAFWHVNSSGLAEIAVSGGRADHLEGIACGTPIAF